MIKQKTYTANGFMKNTNEKKIPRTIKEFTSWEVSRRRFIQGALAVGVFSQMSLLQSCINDGTATDSVLNKKQLDLIIAVQNILFPKDKNGPGAIDFNADKYLLWVLQDKRLDPSENEYIINGIAWVNETAQETHEAVFLKLNKKEQVQLIEKIATTGWGESWLSVLLTFIFEAMISDPIYGFNTDGVGWKWLAHQVGMPRPTKELIYDTVFTTVQNNNPLK